MKTLINEIKAPMALGIFTMVMGFYKLLNFQKFTTFENVYHLVILVLFAGLLVSRTNNISKTIEKNYAKYKSSDYALMYNHKNTIKWFFDISFVIILVTILIAIAVMVF